jgi:hypothetical protein
MGQIVHKNAQRVRIAMEIFIFALREHSHMERVPVLVKRARWGGILPRLVQ